MQKQPNPSVSGFASGLSSFLILGANGQLGCLLSRKLSQTGASVTGIDLDQEASEQGAYSLYLSADLTIPESRVVAAVEQAACVIVCLSESVALAALPGIMNSVSRGALLVDTLSVKANFLEQVRLAGKEIECLSINPMFAPSVDFKAQNVAVIEVASGTLAEEFVNLVRSWGAEVTRVTLEEHDAITACTQVATHAALIVFGSVLSKLGYDVESALRIATPPHRIVLSLLARITLANPEVYWEIQRGNPLAVKVREALAQSIAELSDVSVAANPKGFSCLLSDVRTTIEPEIERLAENCAVVLQNDRLSIRADHD
jgi:4-amino-4-deoxyprephenate dehydrogenase